MIFTTSWDDGYKLDLRLAELLEKYGCTGTFYICPQKQHGLPMMTDEEIRHLNEKHEVGAHTITHRKLTKISAEEARQEISASKKWIEEVTGKPCTTFCYPYGDHDEAVRKIVRESGFVGARTVKAFQFSAQDPFALPTSVQLSPFPFRKRWKCLKDLFDPLPTWRRNKSRLKELGISPWTQRTWLSLAISLFDRALLENQPFFHLWGHSSELERFGMWSDLEKFLKHASENEVEHAPNSSLVSL